jgi:hypothetical protein
MTGRNVMLFSASLVASKIIHHSQRLILISVPLGLLLFLESNAAVNSKIFIGDSIPGFIQTESRLIFSHSDTLILNGRILSRHRDYRFDTETGGFNLSSLIFASTDTLIVKYRAAPRWLLQSFGKPIPEISANSTNFTKPVFQGTSSQRIQPATLTEVSISGAKTFRFMSQTAGNADFGQSLDLDIEGQLSQDLKVIGSISDRGFNPSYGTSNSRLEELDKVNLRLESSSFYAQVGDILLKKRLFQNSPGEKKISGASMAIGGNHLNINAVAARPKGRFTTLSLSGVDGIQGPYQLTESGKNIAIVPNSEAVWLDGQKLVRGSDNDYTMDYPTGRITFSVKNLIDRRSRIEVDFEPVTSDFDTELYSAGSDYQIGDSSVFAAIEWYREGDDEGQPQFGDFGESDRLILQSSGDNESKSVRSGVSADSGGAYIFLADSLPDTVYQYVGENNGMHSIIFSYVGGSKGNYKFSGGDNYYYVGSGNGDYSPVVKLPLPERREYYSSKLGIKNDVVGSIQTDITISKQDKNLLSSLDDHDNEGTLLNFNSKKTFRIGNHENAVSLKIRKKEANFDPIARINSADFSRGFLAPDSGDFNLEERLIEFDSRVVPIGKFTFQPFYGRLEYRGKFKSNRTGFETKLGDSKGMNAVIYWSETNSSLSDSTNSTGYSTTWRGKVSTLLVDSISLSTEYEHDGRRSNYFGALQGIRFDRYAAYLERAHEKITYERYLEDTLITNWSQSLARSRLSGSSIRHLGEFSYNTYFGYQWLIKPDGKTAGFLSRASFRFDKARNKLSVNAAYTLSKETRNARGLTYLEVEPGQGSFIYENGQYVPDPNGNYIQVEELLSDRSSINRGEKSFQFIKDWSIVGVRFSSEIQEELLDGGKRRFWWLVPFLSDDNQPYLVYNRSYNGEFRLVPIKSGHAFNLSLDERTEIRSLGGSPRIRYDRVGAVVLKQVIKSNYLEEQLKIFSSRRDDYYIGAGEVDGFKFGGSVRRPIKNSEIAIGLSFRYAQTALSEKSKTISATADSRVRMIERGDLRSTVEFYSQQFENVTNPPGFVFTDNKPGTKGAVWSTGFNYGVRKGMRINFNLSGRFSDITNAKFFGRTEVVAEF